MAHFRIEFPNGVICEWKKSDHYTATGLNTNAPEGTKYYLKNKQVTREEYLNESEALHAQWHENKCKTHKQIRVLHGSSFACYVTKWVKK
jgi:hypothetical protein